VIAAAEIIRQAKRHGVRLAVFDGIIKASPPNTLPDDLKAAIREHAPEVKALLATRPARSDDRPAEACRWCRGREFWRKADGPWTCQTCHPPVDTPAERCTLPGVESASWIRNVTPNSRAPLIPDAVREKIAAIEGDARNLGWPPELLWNANFWDSPRGLAAVLDADDEIAEVTAEYISILKVKRDLLKFRRHAA
jgi:ribosomal protein L37AE/L43A